MPSAETLTTFFAVALVLGFTPGPDNLFVLMQSATQGRRAGIWVVLGLCAGLVVHTTAVALGLAAVFAQSAMAFTVLKVAGAVYLVYLAWQALHAPPEPMGAAPGVRRRGGKLFLRGVVMNLTNPKVVFFFLALLPQFVEPAKGSVTLQLLVLGLVFVLATLVAFGSVTWFSSMLARRFRQSPVAQLWLNRFAAVVFVGMAARLAMSER